MPSLAERLIKQGKRGKEEGKIEGKQELLIKFLRRKFNITPKEEKQSARNRRSCLTPQPKPYLTPNPRTKC